MIGNSLIKTLKIIVAEPNVGLTKSRGSKR